MAWTTVFITFCVLYGAAQGIDFNSAKGPKCFDIKKTFPGEPQFLASLKTIYAPLISRLELYHTAKDLLQVDEKEILESSIYYDLCPRWSLGENGTILATGFKNKMRYYETKPILPNMEKFELKPAEGKGFTATVYTSLTDNKTFFVAPKCLDNGEMSFTVGSMYPTLPKETYDKVAKHLMELGFRKEDMTMIRYDYCDLDDSMDMEMEATTQSIISGGAL